MITHLHVQNYKCLRDVQVDLAPFTILIGPNDGGKSSLLDVVQLLGKLATQPIQTAFSNQLQQLIWRKDMTSNLLFAVDWTTSDGGFSWQTVFSARDQKVVNEQLQHGAHSFFTASSSKGGQLVSVQNSPSLQLPTNQNSPPLQFQWPTGSSLLAVAMQHRQHPRFKTVIDSLNSTCKYRLDPDALRRPCQLQPDAVLTPTGDNLVAVLDLIIGAPDPSIRFELEQVIQAEIPSLRGLYLPALNNGQKSLEFTLAGNRKPFVTIPATLASEGALLLTAFLAIAYGNTPDILLIEEPENGLHPSRLKHVAELLRKISTGAIGNRPRQVIISTHSPILLNYAKPEEVRVLDRDLDEGTKVISLKSVRDIDKLLKEFAIGELWYMLGEEALLKETPA